MNRLSSRNNRLKLETWGDLCLFSNNKFAIFFDLNWCFFKIVLEESIEDYTPKWMTPKPKPEDVNMYPPVGFRTHSDLDRLLHALKLPGHCSAPCCCSRCRRSYGSRFVFEQEKEYIEGLIHYWCPHCVITKGRCIEYCFGTAYVHPS